MRWSSAATAIQRERILRIVRKHILAASCAAALVSVAAAPAHADVFQLGFILDRSGSIGASNWNIIVDGLSSAIGSLIPVTGADQYEISVVSFSTSASIDVNKVLVDSAATRTALATSIFNLGDGRANDVYTGGNTNFADAFSNMQTALSGSANSPTRSYVNFATDGVQNVGGTGVTERNSLIAAGVDNISIEGIGSGIDATDLQTNFCHPTPCDTTNPYNFPTNGFYIGVADAAGYAAAIGNKIRIVTGQVPEPGTLALIGIALAAFGMTSRRREVRAV
jgi:hypothetical protein